jgi:hypothetical protein
MSLRMPSKNGECQQKLVNANKKSDKPGKIVAFKLAFFGPNADEEKTVRKRELKKMERLTVLWQQVAETLSPLWATEQDKQARVFFKEAIAGKVPVFVTAFRGTGKSYTFQRMCNRSFLPVIKLDAHQALRKSEDIETLVGKKQAWIKWTRMPIMGFCLLLSMKRAHPKQAQMLARGLESVAPHWTPRVCAWLHNKPTSTQVVLWKAANYSLGCWMALPG